jgi:hypothetical protein
MKESAYFWSKDAEVILAPYVQLLVGAERPPTISSPISATPWDYAFDDLLIDLKLGLKARIYGKYPTKLWPTSESPWKTAC